MNIKVKINEIVFKNPIFVASGTFGSGEDFKDFISLETIGAIVTKTVTLDPRSGNAPPRVVETASGMLNSVGLQNKGAKLFKQEDYAKLKRLNTKIIVSIAGTSKEEFVECTKILSEKNFPLAFELNLSCPNVLHGKCRLIAQDPQITGQIISAVKRVTSLPLIVKLTPNVTDIASIAEVAESNGADAISLVNTYLGMAVNAETMRPLLGNVVGGLSGPAIKPLALRAVWEVYKRVSIPVIGIGGITSGVDVAEFILCGARAVQIGTVNFVDPNAHERILQEFKNYLKRKGINRIEELVGQLKM